MNKYFKKFSTSQKGFTIIELIVVIAIIAILAAIVLISISGYIKKGQDASLKETMHTVQTDVISNATTGAGLVFASADPCAYVASPEYGTKAWSEGVIKIQTDSAKYKCASNYTGANGNNPAVNGSKFCACVQELSDTSKYICIDINKQTEITETDASGTGCLTKCSTADIYTCP